MKFILLSMLFLSSAFAYCDYISLPNGTEINMCDTDVDGRNVYLSEGCAECMAKKAYVASRSSNHTDDDSYHISMATEACRLLHGEVVIGIESEEGRPTHLCHYPKDGSYVYAPHLVP